MSILPRRRFLRLTGICAGAVITSAGCSALAPAPTPTPEPTVAPQPASTATPAPPTPISLAGRYIAYCGYNCGPCSKYIDKTCDGCLGEKCVSACTLCAVRKCSREKEVANCAVCPEYSCEKLDKMFAKWEGSGWGESAKEARAVLEEVRKKP